MNFLLMLILFPSFISTREPYKYDLAICAIFKNEAPYLKEWIEFHKLVGVKHFYLYNNLSTDNYLQILTPYIKSGEVEIIEWPYPVNAMGSNWSTIQILAFQNVIKLCQGKVKWLALIDLDEFLFPVEVDDLSEFLHDFEGFASVSVNWQMYGTSNVKKILPKELLIEKLTYKAETDHVVNTHIKSIVRPELVETCLSPHFCNLLTGFFQVNSHKESFYGPFSPVKIDKVRINHYWTRDENFLHQVKIPRRRNAPSTLILANQFNNETDTVIFKYIPKLKKNLGLSKSPHP